jgi:hypothetical protein
VMSEFGLVRGSDSVGVEGVVVGVKIAAGVGDVGASGQAQDRRVR